MDYLHEPTIREYTLAPRSKVYERIETAVFEQENIDSGAEWIKNQARFILGEEAGQYIGNGENQMHLVDAVVMHDTRWGFDIASAALFFQYKDRYVQMKFSNIAATPDDFRSSGMINSVDISFMSESAYLQAKMQRDVVLSGQTYNPKEATFEATNEWAYEMVDSPYSLSFGKMMRRFLTATRPDVSIVVQPAGEKRAEVYDHYIGNINAVRAERAIELGVRFKPITITQPVEKDAVA